MELLIIIPIIALLLLNSAVNIEKATIAVVSRFGKRVSRTLFEGLNFIIPVIDKIDKDLVYSTKLQTMDVNLSFLTANDDMMKELLGEDKEGDQPQVEIILKGTMRWMVNPYIVDENGTLQFSNIAPDKKGGGDPIKNLKSETFSSGLLGKIRSELGRFGGIELYFVFINKRRAIEHYINSILKLKIPPHVNPELYLLRDLENLKKDERGELSEEDRRYLDSLESKLEKFCEDKTSEDQEKDSDFDPIKINEEIPRRHRLEFYDKFSNAMGEILRSDESSNPSKTNHSSVESLYGVELVEFTIDNINLSDKTKEALEKEAQAIGEIEGMVKFSEKARKIAKQVIDASDGDISWKEAMQHAEAVLKLATKENKSFDLEGVPEGLIKL